ncbi:MAG: tryptophanase [Bacteroidota bacterium]
MKIPFAESYKIKAVESIYRSTREEREKWIREAGYNLFNLKSDEVYIDLLTDSGTGAMSSEQWAEIMKGDESYAGASSFYKLKSTIKDLFGFEYFLPTHQGRAAENVLFSTMIKEGDFIPGNAHFDTTKGHIEFRKARAIDCTIDEAYDTSTEHPFKGNADINKIRKVIIDNPGKVPFIIMTITCNTSGGQPVSIQNLKEIKTLAEEYNIPVIFDSARFAENAYFIKTRDKRYKDKTIKEITREMYEYADGMTMSAKKDGIVNIGGFIGLRDKTLFQKATLYNIMFEGFITYGGMAGRDMGALSVGLNESTEFHYLETRVKQVEYLGKKLQEHGIPVQYPFGGHAIFVDAKKFLPHVPKEEYIAQTLAIELYKEAGVRGAEIGTLMADRDPGTRENRYPKLELLRLAIPRRVYTNNHMDVVAIALSNIYKKRDKIKKGYQIVSEQPIMRHFTIELKPF